MTKLLRFPLSAIAIGMVAIGFSRPSISSNCSQTYHTAVDEANRGQTLRAIATVNCLLMPRGIRVGLGSSGAMARAVERGVNTWGDRLPDSPFVFSSAQNPDLKVTFVSYIAQSGEVQGEVHCQRQVYWSSAGSRYKVRGTIQIRDNVDGRPITQTEAASVIEHELGHVLGLEDDEDPSVLMGPFVAGSPVDGPSDEEVRLVMSFRSALNDFARQLSRPRGSIMSRGIGRRGRRVAYLYRRRQ